MTTLTIGGVPEHFNFPWFSLLEDSAFTEKGINLQFKTQEGGTGQMIQNLEEKKIDLAVMLTEGSVMTINKGNPFKIVQKYVQSPLLWGIYTAVDSDLNHIKDLEGKTAAISRFDSGSHLMAYVNSQNQGWSPEHLEFKLSQNIDGAIKNISNQTADYVMWERFTTQPYVDQKLLKHIDDCPTPWPCFVIVAHQDVLEKHPEKINRVLKCINLKTETLKSEPHLAERIAEKMNLKVEEVHKWLDITRWSQNQISKEEIKAIQETLHKLKLIDSIKAETNYIF